MPRIIRKRLPELIPSEPGTVGLLNVPEGAINNKVYLKHLEDKKRKRLKGRKALGLLSIPKGSLPNVPDVGRMGSYMNKKSKEDMLKEIGNY